jgi:hypothetical protein
LHERALLQGFKVSFSGFQILDVCGGLFDRRKLLIHSFAILGKFIRALTSVLSFQENLQTKFGFSKSSRQSEQSLSSLVLTQTDTDHFWHFLRHFENLLKNSILSMSK